jgi:hypothetical protein
MIKLTFRGASALQGPCALLWAACPSSPVIVCTHDVDCAYRQFCDDGVCAATDACASTCPALQTCYRAECVAVSCVGEACRQGEVCVNAHCQPKDCPSCSGNQKCANGACYPVDCRGPSARPTLTTVESGVSVAHALRARRRHRPERRRVQLAGRSLRPRRQLRPGGQRARGFYERACDGKVAIACGGLAALRAGK